MNVNCTKISFHFISFTTLMMVFAELLERRMLTAGWKKLWGGICQDSTRNQRFVEKPFFLLINTIVWLVVYWKTSTVRHFDVTSKETVTFALIMMEITSKRRTTLVLVKYDIQINCNLQLMIESWLAQGADKLRVSEIFSCLH